MIPTFFLQPQGGWGGGAGIPGVQNKSPGVFFQLELGFELNTNQHIFKIIKNIDFTIYILSSFEKTGIF